jgi:hypothetical protein
LLGCGRAHYELAAARREISIEADIILQDEQWRRVVAAHGARVPEDGMRGGAAQLALAHGQLGGKNRLVESAAESRIPPTGDHLPYLGGERLPQEEVPSEPMESHRRVVGDALADQISEADWRCLMGRGGGARERAVPRAI